MNLVNKLAIAGLALGAYLLGLMTETARGEAQTVATWEATAYACPPHCGLTASGVQVGPGSIAAPSWVPFGTVLCVQSWGCGTVVDRGGAITGNRLDLWMPSRAEAFQWGRRNVSVTWGWPPEPAPPAPVEPDEVLEDFVYWDTNAYVRKVVTSTAGVIAVTFEVLG